MSLDSELRVSVGQYSDKGRKPTNQDAHGYLVPPEPLLSSKGVCVAIADGISSSEVSQQASDIAVRTFVDDYYRTSDAWSVRTSGERVLSAINSKLYADTRRSEFRFDKDKGYVCTFSGIVIKSRTAHLFHAGDARIYQLKDAELVQLTEDHRLRISEETSYLNRALGINSDIDVEYCAVPVQQGGLFALVTDGVHEYVAAQRMLELIQEHSDVNRAAEAIAQEAYASGSDDNLTVQLIRVDALPSEDATEMRRKLSELPFPPTLEPGMQLDGYRILRSLHTSHRSHVYLGLDLESGSQVVIKAPSVEQQQDEAYLERFLMEEWIARRVDSPNVLKSHPRVSSKSSLYVVNEFIEGVTLRQWMLDHPRPELEVVRQLVEQIARGLQAFHRQEMLHQDLRSDNVMIDREGTAKIIDFGSARVAGLEDVATRTIQPNILGTVQYTAPEYFLGEAGTPQSDLFSLGVICYQMLSGKLPYGAEVSRARTRAAQQSLAYISVLDDSREIPAWLDHTLRKAVHPSTLKRYAELSEFVYDLRHPSQSFLNLSRPALIERNPVAFWKGVSLLLTVLVIYLLRTR